MIKAILEDTAELVAIAVFLTAVSLWAQAAGGI